MSTTRADLILHPLRLRIIETLVNSEPLTPQEMRMRLPGVAQATLYRHLKILTDSGIKMSPANDRCGVLWNVPTL